jgi:hypothetical protein
MLDIFFTAGLNCVSDLFRNEGITVSRKVLVTLVSFVMLSKEPKK